MVSDTAHIVAPYTGASPYSGRVSAVAVDPTNSNVAYVGGAAGGVWKTENGGTTWTPTFDSQTAIAIGALAVDPQNHNTVWAGTGESNYSDAYFGNGIYRSTDGGATWSKVGGSTFDQCFTADVVVKPTDSNTVLVAVEKTGFNTISYSTSCAQGVYRTTDGGTTWTKVSSGNCRPTDIEVDPNNATIWYVGFSTNTATWSTTPACSNSATPGVYQSKDSGATFQAVGAGLYQTNVTRVAVEVAPTDSQRIYVATATTGDKAQADYLALQTSADGGATWSGFLSYSSSLNGQLSYDLSLAVDPSSSSTFYIGGVFLFKYTEFGAKYQIIGSGAPKSQIGIHVDQHAAVFDGSNRLWIGSDGGAYRTADGGTSFANLNNDLGITEFEPGAAGSLSSKFVAGTQDNSLNAYTGSPAWSRISTLGDAGYSAIDPNNSNVIYGTYPDVPPNGVYVEKTTNGGASYKQISAGISASDPAQFYYPFVMSPTNSELLYVGTDRIWRTETGGGSWSFISPHFPDKVSAIGLAPSSANVLYVGVRGSHLEVTTDGGANWTDTVGNGLPSAYITHVWVDPTNPAIAYTTLSGFDHGHLFRTSDSGQHWTDTSGNLPNTPTNVVAVDTRTSPATLYVGTDVGVLASTDSGATWQQLTGMPNAVVMDLKVDLVPNQLVAVTHGRGAWKEPLASEPTEPPTVTKVKPVSGPVTGGTKVAISGTNFTGATAVTFGVVGAKSFEVISASSISAVSPAEAAGTPDITVTTPGGTSPATAKDRFKFLPTVTKVSPNTGPKAGGTSVTISGAGFALGKTETTFKFGTTTAASVSCSSSTTCIVVAPAHAVGKVDVKATVNKTISAKNVADQFTYS